MNDIEILQSLRSLHINDMYRGKPVNGAITRAIQVLQEKTEKENPQPLTLEQLKERTKPVWANCGTAGDGYWVLCDKGIMVAPSGNCFDAEEIPERQFYDHEPKGVD